MKKLFVLAALALVALVPVAQADMAADIQKLVGDNAINYIHPLTNSIGVTMNSGWYNSSKSYTLFKMPAGLQIYFGEGISVVDAGLKTYQFAGSVQIDNCFSDPTQATALKSIVGKSTLDIGPVTAPTAVGKKEPTAYTMRQLVVSNATTLDTNSTLAIRTAWAAMSSTLNDTVFALPGGLDMDYLPGVPPVVGLNLGLPFKLQLGLRFLPPIKIPNMGKIGQFGLKAQYEFTQWVPVVNNLPLLHTSAMYAFNNINLFDIMKLNNWTAMVNASADFKFLLGLGLYGGIGIESSTMTLDYTVPEGTPGLSGTKVKLEDEGDNFFKAQVGARVSLLIFDIFADATFGETTSYFVGIGLGFNNL
ncbi:MAG: DUF6588 family protein [Fibrobacterota bacterium]